MEVFLRHQFMAHIGIIGTGSKNHSPNPKMFVWSVLCLRISSSCQNLDFTFVFYPKENKKNKNKKKTYSVTEKKKNQSLYIL